MRRAQRVSSCVATTELSRLPLDSTVVCPRIELIRGSVPAGSEAAGVTRWRASSAVSRGHGRPGVGTAEPRLSHSPAKPPCEEAPSAADCGTEDMPSRSLAAAIDATLAAAPADVPMTAAMEPEDPHARRSLPSPTPRLSGPARVARRTSEFPREGVLQYLLVERPVRDRPL